MSRPPIAKRLKRALRYFLMRAALAVVARLPLAWAVRLGEAFGNMAFLLARRERERALKSLEVAFPQAAKKKRLKLARASFVHLGRCAFELACIDQVDRQLEQRVEWPAESQRVLERAMGRKKGVVFVSGHLGNWELLARRVALAGFPSQSIAKETTDPRLNRLIENFRLKGRVGTIWRGRPGAAKQMLRALRAGEILGLVIDQDTRVQSVFVPFFGQLASTPRAAADLVLRTGAALVMGFCPRRPDGRYFLTLQELDVAPSGDYEEDVRELTARMTQEIESTISTVPSQWVWMHRRWKTRPSAEVS